MSTSIIASFDFEEEDEKMPKDNGIGIDRSRRGCARVARGQQIIVLVSRSYVACGSFVSRRAARRDDQAASKGLPSREMKMMSMYRVQKALISDTMSVSSLVLVGTLEPVGEISIPSPEEAKELAVGVGICQMRRSERLSSWEVCKRVRVRWVSVCARVDGGPPGKCAGEHPVASSIFGTTRFNRAISSASSLRMFLASPLLLPSSSSSSSCVSVLVLFGGGILRAV